LTRGYVRKRPVNLPKAEDNGERGGKGNGVRVVVV